MPRLILTDDQHERANRFRNHVNLWLAYAIIAVVALCGGLVVIAWTIRLTLWALA